MKYIIDFNTAMEIASHEALVRQAYKDSVGVWTWSIGLTSATGHLVERYIGKPQTVEHCLSVWLWALQRYAADVEEAFVGYTLKPHEFAAALSFHWNTGAIKKATWVKNVKAGNFPLAKKNFMAYNKPTEIIGRRTKEAKLFFDGIWSNDGMMTEFTEVTAKHTPKWSSAEKIDVKDTLNKLLRVIEDVPTVPSAPPKPKENWFLHLLRLFWNLLTIGRLE